MNDPLFVTVECWENQRYSPTRGWGLHHLPMDRSAWSNKKGDIVLCRESFLNPIGWTWASKWELAPNGTHHDGWFYAVDFSIPTRLCTSTPNAISYVRRRRWVRTRVRLREATNIGSSLQKNVECSFSFPADSRDLWLATAFYGFVGASVVAQRENERRQHQSFFRLQQCLDLSLQCFADKAFLSAGGSEEQHAGTGKKNTTDVALRYPHSSVTPTVRRCVYRYGVAQCLRPALWFVWSGGSVFLRESPNFYNELLERSDSVNGRPLRDILQDVARTAPLHPFFSRNGSGAKNLLNVLVALEAARVLPSYHQAFSYIVAAVLLNLPMRETFWVVTALFTNFLPRGYHEEYTLQHDIRLLEEILSQRLPDVHAQFLLKRIDVSVFASGWLQALFCAHFPFCSAAQILDVLFADGDSSVLVRFLVAFSTKFRLDLLTMDSSGSLGQFANEWARNCFDVSDVIRSMEDDGLRSFVLSRRLELACCNCHVGVIK